MKFKQASGKESRLSFGTYPDVSLAQARVARSAARQLRAADIDPGKAKRDEKLAKVAASAHTFEALAREWLKKTASDRAASTQSKNTAWLEKNVFPEIGTMPISTIKPRDVLAALRKIEARGAIESAHKIKQICGQIFRYAVASGLTERDVTSDLRDALAAVPEAHYAAITEPKQVAELLRAIHTYTGHPYATAALKLAPMVFQRPGELRSMEWVGNRLGQGGVEHPGHQNEDEVKVPFRAGRAQLRIQAWGGFTVGVRIPRADVVLECDLAQIDDAPLIIKTR